MILLLLLACGGSTDGRADGCDAATAEGYEWGGDDAASCLDRDATPPPFDMGSDDYATDYEAGYEDCYEPAYHEGYDDAIDLLGECEDS